MRKTSMLNNLNHKPQIYAKVCNENEEENKEIHDGLIFFALKKIKFDT